MAAIAPGGGRKKRGNRATTTVRMPVEHLKIYRETAERLGMPLGDFVAVKMAEACGLPRPDYIPEPTEDRYPQEALIAS